MGTYLLRRLAISVPVLLGITLVVYVIISLAPGDPVDAMINPEMVASLGPGCRRAEARGARAEPADPGALRDLAKEVAAGQPRLLVHGPAADRGEDRRAARGRRCG